MERLERSEEVLSECYRASAETVLHEIHEVVGLRPSAKQLLNLSKLTDAMWRQHANPWSVWTRLLSTPLTYVPFWNRSWKQELAVAAWFAINPFLFPKPSDDDAWAARAIRGERQWAKDRPLDASLAIQAAGSAAFVGGFYSAYKNKLCPTIGSAAVVIACNAWFLDRMTNYEESSAEEV